MVVRYCGSGLNIETLIEVLMQIPEPAAGAREMLRKLDEHLFGFQRVQGNQEKKSFRATQHMNCATQRQATPSSY
jgi:hypothetical protein